MHKKQTYTEVFLNSAMYSKLGVSFPSLAITAYIK